MVAFTYLVPKGWEPKTSFTWNGQSFISDFKASTPDGQYTVEHLQPLSMAYGASNGRVMQGFRIASGTDFLHGLVGQMEKSGMVSNARVTEEYNADAPLTEIEKNLPKPLPSIGGMQQRTFNQSAFLKLSFEKNGQPMVASVGTTVYGTFLSNNMQLGYGRTSTQYSSENGSYVIGPTLVVISPANPSPAKVHEIQIMASSSQMTPSFMNYCARLALGMSEAQYKATKERGKQLIQQMREQTQQIHDNFMDEMARKDADTHEFCNYLLDKQDYTDHSGNLVTLPTAYDHSWSDGNGNFVLNDDPTFNPKKDMGMLGYQELQKTPAFH
jgi:hypothetical protein